VASDNAIAAAQQQTTQDAQQQANAVLSVLTFTKEVVSIQVNAATPPAVLPYAQAASADRAVSCSRGGEQQVEASVTLQISY